MIKEDFLLFQIFIVRQFLEENLIFVTQKHIEHLPSESTGGPKPSQDWNLYKKNLKPT